jgi:hypothetical protein
MALSRASGKTACTNKWNDRISVSQTASTERLMLSHDLSIRSGGRVRKHCNSSTNWFFEKRLVAKGRPCGVAATDTAWVRR